MILPRRQPSFITAIEQLSPYDHLCSIYEHQQEHYAVAIPFAWIALDRAGTSASNEHSQ
jgi:hypothetical protein